MTWRKNAVSGQPRERQSRLACGLETASRIQPAFSSTGHQKSAPVNGHESRPFPRPSGLSQLSNPSPGQQAFHGTRDTNHCLLWSHTKPGQRVFTKHETRNTAFCGATSSPANGFSRNTRHETRNTAFSRPFQMSPWSHGRAASRGFGSRNTAFIGLFNASPLSATAPLRKTAARRPAPS